MIRLNFPLRRQQRMSRAEFQRYWRETHGPLVSSFATALRIRRYVQSHSVDDPLYEGLRVTRPGMEDPHDGIACLWWDSRADLLAAMESPEGRKAGAMLLEDEQRFIDLERSSIFVAQELAQVNPMGEDSIVATPSSSWIKLCYLLNPRPGMSWTDCQRTWNMDHGYLVRRHSGVTRLHRYIQCHTLEDPLNDALRASRNARAPYAGLTECWFDRYELKQALADPSGEAARAFGLFLEDEKRFVDFTKSCVWGTKEVSFIDRVGD